MTQLELFESRTGGKPLFQKIRLRCVDTTDLGFAQDKPLTIGKEYAGILWRSSTGAQFYKVMNDRGMIGPYFTDRFEVLDYAT